MRPALQLGQGHKALRLINIGVGAQPPLRLRAELLEQSVAVPDIPVAALGIGPSLCVSLVFGDAPTKGVVGIVQLGDAPGFVGDAALELVLCVPVQFGALVAAAGAARSSFQMAAHCIPHLAKSQPSITMCAPIKTCTGSHRQSTLEDSGPQTFGKCLSKRSPKSTRWQA
jgi:hypothetical protein